MPNYSTQAFLQHLLMAGLLCLYTITVCSQEVSYDWPALNRGDVIVESISGANDVPGVRVTFAVKASRENIWATLVDYDNFQKIFVGINRMRVVSHDNEGAQIEFWIDAVLKNLNYILYRDYAQPGYRLTWVRVSGDLKDIHGSWEIQDTVDPEKLLLVYESYVDVGTWVISKFVQLGAQNRARDMAYRLRVWVEKKP